MSRFLKNQYQSLEAYVPGEQPQDMVYTKLNTNESPFPPSPAVLAAVCREEAGKLQLYPDPDCKKLREKLAETYGVKPGQVFLSNGSDDILNFAFMAFSGDGITAEFPDISYGFYKVYARLHGVSYREVPLREDFSIAPEDYKNDGFVCLANPNAPTGLSMSLCQIESLLKQNPDHVVLIDEAYVDFGGETALPLLEKYPNLLVVRTYSKSRSMAGARLGFAIGSEEVISDLNRIKFSTNPYNINRITMAAGIAALEEDGYYRECCRTVCENREFTAQKLTALGFEVLPSKTNFLFARSSRVGGEKLYTELKKRGILIRHFSAERIKDYNRITVGTGEQMEKLLAAVEEILEAEK